MKTKTNLKKPKHGFRVFLLTLVFVLVFMLGCANIPNNKCEGNCGCTAPCHEYCICPRACPECDKPEDDCICCPVDCDCKECNPIICPECNKLEADCKCCDDCLAYPCECVFCHECDKLEDDCICCADCKVYPCECVFCADCSKLENDCICCPIDCDCPYCVIPRAPFNDLKRGVGYSFMANHTPDNSTIHTVYDFDLLAGGANGIGWFYNWGITANDAVISAASEREVDFIPMAWRYLTDEGEANLRRLVAENPNISYLRAINEPNLTDQGNRTPQQFIEHPNGWTRLVRVARELDLKIIAPALNFGTLPGYHDPNVWLDEFLAHPLVDKDDIHALSFNVYMSWPGAFKGFVERFVDYGLPIWISEFCAWYTTSHGVNRPIMDWEWQSFFMSQTVAFMEQNPIIERYAWFIPKGHRDPNSHPNNFLLDRGAPPSLTDIGIIYTNMSRFCRETTFLLGDIIDAAQVSRNNIYDTIGVVTRPTTTWQDSVNFFPITDTFYMDMYGALEVRDFTNNMWIEYEIEVPADMEYALTLRYMRNTNRTAQSALTAGGITTPTNIDFSINGDVVHQQQFITTEWNTTTIPLGSLPAGRHTLRLRSRGGNLSLNWLQVVF